MVDVTQQIYDKLAATSAVTDLAGNRIWGDRNTPIKTYRPDQGACIAFEPRGGLASYDRKILTLSYKFKIYGDTGGAAISPQKSAFNLFSVVYDTLKDASFGNVCWSGGEVTYQVFEEFALNWPFTLSFFQFKVIDS